MLNININFCRWLDSNRRPLVVEATALPTQPQPLPFQQDFYLAIPSQRGQVAGKIAKKHVVLTHEKIILSKKMAEHHLETSRAQ